MVQKVIRYNKAYLSHTCQDIIYSYLGIKERHYEITITKYISTVILNLQTHNEQKLYLKRCCENEVLEKEYLIGDNNCTIIN